VPKPVDTVAALNELTRGLNLLAEAMRRVNDANAKRARKPELARDANVIPGTGVRLTAAGSAALAQEQALNRRRVIAYCREAGIECPSPGSQEWDSALNAACEAEAMAEAHARIARDRSRRMAR
jgi:hypothetical protein